MFSFTHSHTKRTTMCVRFLPLKQASAPGVLTPPPNSSGMIPPELGALPALTYVGIFRNSLTGEKLPRYLFMQPQSHGLVLLTSVFASTQNRLCSFPTHDASTSLKTRLHPSGRGMHCKANASLADQLHTCYKKHHTPRIHTTHHALCCKPPKSTKPPIPAASMTR